MRWELGVGEGAAMSPSEVEVIAGAMERASQPLAAAQAALDSYGAAVASAVTAASGAAGDGPLAGVLETFAEDAKKRAEERGDECRELSQGLLKAMEAFRQTDTNGAGAMRPPSFGGVTG